MIYGKEMTNDKTDEFETMLMAAQEERTSEACLKGETEEKSGVGAMPMLTFTSFDTEGEYDFVYLYDGSTTSADQLPNPGSRFSGGSNPGSFTSFNADGDLLLRFTSDDSVTNTGFAGTYQCHVDHPVQTWP